MAYKDRKIRAIRQQGINKTPVPSKLGNIIPTLGFVLWGLETVSTDPPAGGELNPACVPSLRQGSQSPAFNQHPADVCNAKMEP